MRQARSGGTFRLIDSIKARGARHEPGTSENFCGLRPAFTSCRAQAASAARPPQHQGRFLSPLPPSGGARQRAWSAPSAFDLRGGESLRIEIRRDHAHGLDRQIAHMADRGGDVSAGAVSCPFLLCRAIREYARSRT